MSSVSGTCYQQQEPELQHLSGLATKYPTEPRVLPALGNENTGDKWLVKVYLGKNFTSFSDFYASKGFAELCCDKGWALCLEMTDA